MGAIRFSRVAQAIPPNIFADMDVKVARAIAGGAHVIDLSKGNPDAYPEAFIRDVAKQAVDDPHNACYTPFDGKGEYLRAAADWYRDVHGVSVDPATEIFAVEGAVDGLAGLTAILLDRGDAVAFADPYYPSYHCMAVMAGAEEILLPAVPSLGWLPDLDAVPADVWRRLRVLVLNYPNNPTGAQAPVSFFERAVALAHEYGFVIVHDFAYTGLGVDPGNQQISLLAVPDALDVAVEVDSLSKQYAMAGWRAGFVAGNAEIVSHLKRYHYQMGSMITGMIQDAGIAALRSDQSCVGRLAARYARRRAIIADGLRDLGLDVFDSAGGIFVWARAPHDMDGSAFAEAVLREAEVAILPGSCFGRVGERYVRFSLLKDETQLVEAVRRLKSARTALGI
ncbi:pyridoxal phosphate-dependent aminotransferase [Bifidobacterium simiarum]|uniref:pyridoxal phosphate-dependent aminotransferase n=1 Tax=Bifidobacterium simiarum TaxID=2045441 RepID=UPI001BDC3196|nr:aminotransferase class I/II-fold pyridoxal phosphate-dependent enzyme [Bifidobacterium simiarum]MBT1166531.1 aminotransferase class I/II-fold pyridoxal phosphate-dependent enzyme [Bifidobacterium simiarum]